MHAKTHLEHVVIFEKGITSVFSIEPPYIIQPHLDMGIKWNRALVIPSPESPQVEVGECLTVKVIFPILSLGEALQGFQQIQAEDIDDLQHQFACLYVQLGSHQSISHIIRGKPCQLPHLP